jgi:hypothetical protein
MEAAAHPTMRPGRDLRAVLSSIGILPRLSPDHGFGGTTAFTFGGG